MVKVSTETLLSLEQYAEILGYEPRHFQSVLCKAFPDRTDVDDVIFKYSWQNFTQASHEEIAVAIAAAEERIASYIGFWPAPKYITEEWHPYPSLAPISGFVMAPDYNPRNATLRKPTVHCKWKKFIKGGRRKVDLVSESETIIYSDEDSDGFDETATITVTGLTTTGWLPKEIGVYRSTDTDPVERIRGLKVTISGGTVTIVGQSVLFLDPDQWEHAKDGNAVDGDDSGSYLTKVNIYREYCSDEGVDYAALLYLSQSSSASPLSAFTATYGVLQPYDKERSIVSLIPATWDDDTSAWTSRNLNAIPSLVQLNYLAGIDTDSQGRMQPMLARAVAALATALITKPVVSVGPPENLQQQWQVAVAAGEVPFGVYSCPWGIRLGAYEAYSIVRELFPEGIGTASV